MFRKWGFLAVLLGAALALSGGALAETRYVVGGSLRLREAPGQEARALGSLYAGAPVEVLDESQGWCRVQIAELIAYMKADFLAPLAAADETRSGEAASPYGTPTVILRSRPSNSYSTVGFVRVGERVRILGEMEGGYFCVTAEGLGFLDQGEVR